MRCKNALNMLQKCHNFTMHIVIIIIIILNVIIIINLIINIIFIIFIIIRTFDQEQFTVLMRKADRLALFHLISSSVLA